MVRMGITLFEVVIYNNAGNPTLFRVSPKSITGDMVLQCLLIQTALYYQFARLFQPEAVAPIKAYAQNIFPDVNLDEFPQHRPPKLYVETLRAYAEVCGLRCPDDGTPPCDFLGAAAFRELCEAILPEDLAELRKLHEEKNA